MGTFYEAIGQNHWTRGREANSWVFCWAAESEWLEIVEELAPTQIEEELPGGLRADTVGAPATTR
jgi:hypothetical protein